MTSSSSAGDLGGDLASSIKAAVTDSSLAASTSARTGTGRVIRSARLAVEFVTVVEPSSSSSSGSISWNRLMREGSKTVTMETYEFSRIGLLSSEVVRGDNNAV